MKLSRTDFRKQADFRYWIRRFLRASEEHARAAGLGASQFLLLLAVKGSPEGTAPNITSIAQRMLVETHSVVELVDRCVRSGLLERFREGVDQRKVFLRLTDLGNEMVEKIAAQNREELMDAIPALVEFLKSLV